VIEERFGESSPLSLGVEEELMVVDAETYEPVPAVERLQEALGERELHGQVKTELFASMVEVATPVARDAREALASVVELRRRVAGAAQPLGLAIAAAGTHPLTPPDALDVVQERRYLEMVEYAGPSALRQTVTGLHVHVGMPSGDDCLRALEWMLPWLPVVLALSANSPYLHGREAGFASSRAVALAELPRSGAPPYFATYADWRRHVGRLGRLQLPRDYTALWWDVRPHPRFGTLEVRVPDQPTAAARTGAFVALLQALCATALDAPARAEDPGGRGIYQQNRWAAARFGPRAELIDPDATRRVRASELARELLQLVLPAAQDLGSDELLRPLDPDRCEGDRQLEVGRAAGLTEVARDIVARTVESGA
jgi:glutamate---cysteine ligase / carboxylate-amine ligase